MDIVLNRIKDINEIKSRKEYESIEKRKGKNTFTLRLKAVLRTGDRVILYKEHKDEVADIQLKQRLFTIFKFNEPTAGVGYVYLQHHLEARPNEELSKLEEKDFIPEKYQPRIFLSPDKMNCLIEHIDFSIKADGTIERH